MDREQIKKHLPHRNSMLLLDSCQKIDAQKSQGTYTIKGDEFFLDGHFPEYKVVPGVILCEIMAQSSFPIFLDDLQGNIPMYAGIKSARFKKQVRPGDTVIAECQVINVKRPFYSVESKIICNNTVYATGELMFCLVPKNKLNG